MCFFGIIAVIIIFYLNVITFLIIMFFMFLVNDNNLGSNTYIVDVLTK